MRLLILGGTAFVGRAIVAGALRTGADVTLFGRGRTGTELFPGVPRLIGDRDTGDYTALRTGTWDAVVDVSGYVPRHVGQAMGALGDRVGRYLFISSNAVFDPTGSARRPPRRDTEERRGDSYGPLKVACEDDVLARYGSRATIVRPGQVVGPHDPHGTLTYWVRRAAQGGRVELPGQPEQPVQVLDARDLGRLVVQLLLDDRDGAYTAVGPAEPTTMAGLVATCARVAGTTVEVVPVRSKARAPLVRPAPEWPSQRRDPAPARAAGMPATPLAATVADVLASLAR